MTGSEKQQSPVSKIIRERALAILRDTRSKIDPKLLDAMKEHLAASMPEGALPASAPRSPLKDADMPLSAGAGAKNETKPLPKAASPAAAAAYRQSSTVAAPPPKKPDFSDELSRLSRQRNETPGSDRIAEATIPVSKPEVSYPRMKMEDGKAETEPVDRQKIARIVLQYMKSREDRSEH